MQWTWIGATAALAFVGLTWLADGPARGSAPVGEVLPARPDVWVVTGDDAEARRRGMLQRAEFEYATPRDSTLAAWRAHITGEAGDSRADDASETEQEPTACRFVPSVPSGTSPKFDCLLDDGTVIKVKYGRNPEIHAETAATALLRRLNYPADDVIIVPRLRCYGCPRFPFVTMTLVNLFALPLAPAADDEGYREFSWVSIERKFPAVAIETADASGWAWWELANSLAPRADIDALRLTAAFLAHWDNKSENQRLVCLDRPMPPADLDCRRPLAMIQDLGATFGPTKANLARWQGIPVWSDRTTCRISMAAMPYGGGSFPDATISEAGRAKLAARLEAIPDAEVERLFAEARFPEFQIGTDDPGDLEAWVKAFRDRADQIVQAQCPDRPDES